MDFVLVIIFLILFMNKVLLKKIINKVFVSFISTFIIKCYRAGHMPWIQNYERGWSGDIMIEVIERGRAD